MKRQRMGRGAVIVLLLFGLSLLLYPTISSLYNAMGQSRVIAGYEAAAEGENQRFAEWLDKAKAYNAELAARGNDFALSTAEKEAFSQLLDEAGAAIGYVEIPVLDERFPLYLGTGEEVLRKGIGVLEGSSLPVGGESTHTVLTGHRGLPSATLFTHLDRVCVGDRFRLCVLGETMLYEVDEIQVVEPQETQALNIQNGADLCTLVTCTPYGVNSHRLLVRGVRVTEQRSTGKQARATAAQIPWETAAVTVFAMSVGGVALGVGGVRLGRGISLRMAAWLRKRKGGNGNAKMA